MKQTNLTRLTVTTTHPTDYVLINEADGTRWRGGEAGAWVRELAVTDGVPATPAKASTLDERIDRAAAEIATWSPEKLASMQLQGGGGIVGVRERAAARPLLLSDPEAQEDVRRLADELASDPKKATAFLQQAGILNAAGKLAPEFGGEPDGVRVLPEGGQHFHTFQEMDGYTEVCSSCGKVQQRLPASPHGVNFT